MFNSQHVCFLTLRGTAFFTETSRTLNYYSRNRGIPTKQVYGIKPRRIGCNRGFGPVESGTAYLVSPPNCSPGSCLYWIFLRDFWTISTWRIFQTKNPKWEKVFSPMVFFFKTIEHTVLKGFFVPRGNSVPLSPGLQNCKYAHRNESIQIVYWNEWITGYELSSSLPSPTYVKKNTNQQHRRYLLTVRLVLVDQTQPTCG